YRVRRLSDQQGLHQGRGRRSGQDLPGLQGSERRPRQPLPGLHKRDLSQSGRCDTGPRSLLAQRVDQWIRPARASRPLPTRTPSSDAASGIGVLAGQDALRPCSATPLQCRGQRATRALPRASACPAYCGFTTESSGLIVIEMITADDFQTSISAWPFAVLSNASAPMPLTDVAVLPMSDCACAAKPLSDTLGTI